MNERDDGGAAFPHSDFMDHWQTTHGASAGMSLRDYFAAKAVHAFIRGSENGTEFGTTEAGLANNTRLAGCAYAMADAMLKARSA